MGAAKINLRDYATVDKAVEMWLDVKACKGCPNATGQIKVSFTWAPELSEEEKQRRAEEARRRLYEKPDQGRSDAGDVDTIMERAEKRLAELKAKDIGDYLKEECESNETLKMQIEEGESELEKVVLAASSVFLTKPSMIVTFSSMRRSKRSSQVLRLGCAASSSGSIGFGGDM